MISCSPETDEYTEDAAADSTEYQTDLEHGDFTGVWTTPAPYDAYENARLNVQEQNEAISGVLHYARTDTSTAEEARRFFWDGQMEGNTAIIDIRNDDGDAVGQARLALMGEDMAVQLLESTPVLPEIFVLRRSDEE